MENLKRAGEEGSIGDLDISQGDFRGQMDVVSDEMRQLAGNAITPGDPLNAPYILYVNPYTGSDTFVGGQFVADSASSLERRISNQRLECGYTEARPFKTINRAAIEAGIITSREYFSQDPELAKIKALVTIQLSSGEHIAGNGTGEPLSAGFPELDETADLTFNELVRFNDDIKGAIILPRGCSLISLDLRKTVIRPDFTPRPNNEEDDYSNRRSIFKVTGGGYYYGITFKDNLTAKESHHLLHCFEFARKDELDKFYEKIVASFAKANINNTFGQTEETEFEIVGPKPPLPSEPTDTVNSASPYIYNCSIRSVYGLCGVFGDGGEVNDPNGFRSMVVAQFTGVSLQKDLRAWEKYVNGSWEKVSNSANDAAAYQQYISLDPNDVRMRVKWRSVHVRAVNDCIIQEVSVFAIGQGIHHLAERGGELTVTNSNSNFGGCAALAKNFRRVAQAFDSNFEVTEVRTAVNPLELGNQVTEITLGFVQSRSGDFQRIDLTQALLPGRVNPDQPEILDSLGYSLKAGDYVWIENPNGPDYRAVLDTNAYNINPGSGKSRIRVQAPGFQTNGGEIPGDNNSDSFQTFPPLNDLRVYVRRFQDVRTIEQRRFSLKVSSPSGNRLPVRDYVLQPTNNNTIYDAITSIRGSEVDNDSVNEEVRIELNYVDRDPSDSTYQPSKFYRKGDVVRRFNKHFVARADNTGIGSQIEFFETYAENFVHMQEDYAPGGNFKNAQPILIFDKDTQPEPVTSSRFLLGNDITDTEVEKQIVSATDYIATEKQLINFGAGDFNSLLSLKKEEDRDTDIRNRGYTFELRRPSNIRLFGQAWEWAGFLNYTKALPDYQQTLSPENKFTYFFTDEGGGKVFCNGFNEEGLQVSPRGLEDVTTGEVLDADNLSSPDRTINPITTFENLTVKTLNVNNYDERSQKATQGSFGIARLFNPNDTDPDRDPNGRDVVAIREADERYAKAQARDLPFQIFHVVPRGATKLTGPESVPFGFPTDDKNAALQLQDDQTPIETITEAFAEASKVFVPSGSQIVISVHGSRSMMLDEVTEIVEQGPLQLANGFAEVIVAGARGAAVPPTVFLKRGGKNGTNNALERTPQYSREFSFSAGVTFQDITLDCDCGAENNTFATINGGFGVGGFDTSIIWRNCKDVTAIGTTYGKQGLFFYFNDEVDGAGIGTVRKFIQQVVDPRDDNIDLQFFGSARSGLISQGSDVIIDFRAPDTGRDGDPKLVFAYDVEGGDGVSKVNVEFIAVGDRGGCQHGGRVIPIVDFDFGGSPRLSLLNFCSLGTRTNQNYFGKSFRVRETTQIKNPFNASSPGWNMSEESLNEFKALISGGGFIELTNGCCIDIDTENGLRAGPFGFYLQLEKYLQLPGEFDDSNLKLLRADSSTNSFIYGGENRDVTP